MKANELRIGNWFIEYDEPQQFDGDFYHLISIKPIPLTKEWLLKFGFIEIHENNWQDIECEIMVDLFNDTISIISAMPWKQLNHIKHVHQLQNLYFALTGEELSIK